MNINSLMMQPVVKIFILNIGETYILAKKGFDTAGHI